MANKFLTLILGLLLIVQTLNAAPAASAESGESKELREAKAFLERLKLMLITLEEFGKMFEEISDKGPKVFEAVLKDPKIQEVKTETMEKNLKELRDYIEKTEQVKKDSEKDEAFDMFDTYKDIVDKYDSEKVKDLSSEALLIEKSLKEHGLDEIESSMVTHFKSFMQKFKDEAEEYLTGLTSKESKDEESFKEWFAKLKDEKDVEKQIELFDKFIDSDEED